MAVDPNQNYQYPRAFSLIVSNSALNGIDLSQLRVKFSVKRSSTQTPNTADIRVYNLSDTTALLIKKEFTKVTLQAGYKGNFGVIFQGNIKQVIIGRESATDTFIDIVAGDGDQAYNFAVVTTTLAAGATQMDQVNSAVGVMAPKGVTAGGMGAMPPAQLPRGKVMYGNANKYLRNVAKTTGQSWSIQDEKVTFVPLKSYAKGVVTVLTSKTGMIGTPQQTNEGVNIKCLLNPRIQINGRVQIDNKSIEQFKINLTVPNSAANIPAPLTADGVYFVFVVEYTGDTRGVEWYCNLITLYIDPTTNPLNAVSINYGG